MMREDTARCMLSMLADIVRGQPSPDMARDLCRWAQIAAAIVPDTEPAPPSPSRRSPDTPLAFPSSLAGRPSGGGLDARKER
jgi:hypothetical protein